MNGGMLAKRIRDRGAELIGFGISDAVGTPATGDIGEPYKNYKGTPMGPDQTTLEEARQVIRDYGVADRLPKSVVDYLMHVGPEGETPKGLPREPYFLLSSLPDSCLTAKRASPEMRHPGRDPHLVPRGARPERSAPYLPRSPARSRTTATPSSRRACCCAPVRRRRSSIIPPSPATAAQVRADAHLRHLSRKRRPAACACPSTRGPDGADEVAGGITDSTSYDAAEAKGIQRL